MKLVEEKNWPPALAAMQSIVERKNFNSLPADFRYKVLSTAGRVATDHGPPMLAYNYLGRVIVMPQADFADWLDRVRAADKLGHKAVAISALTELIQRWPEHSGKFDTDHILRDINDARNLPNGAELKLLEALYAAHWKAKWDIEPSETWRDLSLILLGKNRLAEANDVASHVTDVYVLIAMRADRRFDAVVAANSAQFDIEAAAEREFHAFQAAADQTPQALQLKSWVISSLLRQRHYEAALAASDSILMDIQSTNYPAKLFEDFDEEHSWFLNLRSTALQRVGHWDEALDQLTAASRLLEKYGGNVDQLINLGGLYCSLGRPNDALSAIGSVTAGTSPLGTMEMEEVRIDAAQQLGDAKQVERSLKYLRTHRTDAPNAYEAALIIVNQLDRAARELVVELRDSAERQDALLSIQDFAPTPGTPRDMDFDARHRKVIADPGVQAEIRKVGRVESYPVESP
jgi:tetratricopeptide (TPR) repeat protein